MPTAPPSAAPESLVSLPVPEMQDRVISTLIWQIIYLLSPHSQEIVLAQKSLVLLWGSLGRWFCTREQNFPQLTERMRQKNLCPLLLTSAEQKFCTGHKALQISASCALQVGAL